MKETYRITKRIHERCIQNNKTYIIKEVETSQE